MERPRVIVFSSISIDGGLGVRGAKSKLSSGRDLYRLHYMRSLVDAVMVGANTVLIDDPLLTVRLPGYRGRQPLRVVVDGKLRCDPRLRVFDTKIAPTVIITSKANAEDPRIEEFRDRNVEIIFSDELGDGYVDLVKALKELRSRFSVGKVLVEGGGLLIGSLFKQKLIDQLYVSLTPWIIGLEKTTLVETRLKEMVRLRLEHIFIDEETGEVILSYKPLYR